MLNTLQKICAVYFVLLITSIQAQNIDLTTYYEKSGYKETPKYEQTIEFCKKLDSASSRVKFISYGKSPQYRDLPLLIADKNRNFTPETVRKSGNVVLLIQACIHAGEPEGKDAGLTLLRDIITIPGFSDFLNHVTILFIPIVNVDGHERFGKYNRINQNGPVEMGWRTTANNLNLNRDFVKADAEETRSWLKLFNEWLPDFFIDCHTTDGADYQYVITYGLETNSNCDKNLAEWQKSVYLKLLEKEMLHAGMPIIPYVTFRKWHDPRSGLRSSATPPMLSQGYTIARNRPGLLIETHMLKDYKKRVTGTYKMIENTLRILNNEYQNLQNIIKKADEFCISENFRKTYFPLNFKNSMNDSIMVDYLGVEYKVEKSDLTGGEWFQYDNKKPVTFKIPYFNKNIVIDSTLIPKAYIIGPEWKEVISRLQLHGIKMDVLKESKTFKVDSYKFKNVVLRNTSYEGHQQVSNFEMEKINEERTYIAGSVIIYTNQPMVRIIATMLEPKANGSLLEWGFFNTIFEQKEYTESYVMENLARNMLKENPQLNIEFLNFKNSNPELVKDPYAMINWFYSKSPYWDNRMNVYPVGMIF